MDEKKDYYSVLGVLPDAESVVIRAAYKALAQRYHPDKFDGPREMANQKMAAINEAYEVLSDSARRKEYDTLRSSQPQSNSAYFGEEDTPPRYDPLEQDWQLATKYYPDLPKLEASLQRFAWRLAYAYRAYLLQEKDFDNRVFVAQKMEHDFLTIYFGSNQKLLDFARKLIFASQKSAEKELNETLRVLGSKVDPSRIIETIKQRFNLSKLFEIVEYAQIARTLRDQQGYDTVGIRLHFSELGLTPSAIEAVIVESYR